MTDELTLLPCPFCGGNGKLIESHRYDASVDSTPPHWKVSCECVGCNGAAINIWRQSEEEALKAWNHRVEPDTLPSWAIEAIEKAFNETGWLYQDSDDDGSLYAMLRQEILSLRKPEEKE